jgi:hypothetical protein
MIAGILVKAFLERGCHTVPQVAAGALRGIVRASREQTVPTAWSLWITASGARILIGVCLANFSPKRLLQQRLPHWHAMTASLVEGLV